MDTTTADHEFRVRAKALTFASKQNRHHCAIADAIAYANPDARHIRVDRDEIRFTDVTTRIRYRYRTPKNAVRFIDRWDAGEPVSRITVKVTDADLIEAKPASSRPPTHLMTRAVSKSKSGQARVSRPRSYRMLHPR